MPSKLSNIGQWKLIVRLLTVVMAIDGHQDPREHLQIFESLKSRINPGYSDDEKYLIFNEEIYQAVKEMGVSEEEKIKYLKDLLNDPKLDESSTKIFIKAIALKVAKADEKIVSQEETALKLIKDSFIV